MAFGKKGWRRIVVGNQVYYWQPVEADWWLGTPQPNILCARPEHESHRLLTVTCGMCNNQTLGFNWRVTPNIARVCVESATASGWLGARPKLRSVLFGSLRSVIVQPFWLTTTVRTLVEGFYAGTTFDQLPILADALQDAGCNSDDILNHLRSPGPHVGDCWAQDLLLNSLIGH
ncbi:hypothetical protein VT84_13000 [Gemmata sp. SH-PL17]|uniref:hypothetical protein n=1 Tax=Gemmata sp. SH-PL17 TaxID=1630693 RepID=UPI0004B093BA|nr:hypothetical protein [Gemmata sp. SH-PL17]AMV25311.1 hypothetical protein VT84_13000 [Gemmata sp. SH-PL17]